MVNLIRYQLDWKTPTHAIMSERDDGHWTKWDIATRCITQQQAKIEYLELKLANAYHDAEQMGEVNLFAFNRKKV